MSVSELPVLKVAIISDVQGYDYPADWGMHNLERAFEVLAPMGPDVILNAGDLGDHGDDNTPTLYYMGLCRKYFGDNQPVQVTCLGNHDYWAHDPGRTQDDCRRDFNAALGEPDEPIIRKVIGGYDFIAFSSDNDHSYDAEDCARLVPYLDAAVARDPSKPIFLATHFHPKDTVDASHGSSGRPALREILNRYPQVVSFSGHTHSPLHDERCIWQGEFTAVNTSGLSYACVPERCVNCCGPIPPFAREALYFMFMEVYEDRLVIRRYNAEDQVEIKPDRRWTVALPYDPSKAVYTDARAEGREAPAFAPGTQMYFRYDYGYVYFVFDQAHHDDFVHFYRLALTELDADGNAVETKSYRYIGNFYRLERNRDHRLVLKAPPFSMEAGKRYRCEMFPVESFGREGDPLTITVDVRPSYGFRNAEESGPQE